MWDNPFSRINTKSYFHFKNYSKYPSYYNKIEALDIFSFFYLTFLIS